ncbi:GIY-YIG nuclease family protein [Verrucomicrobiales bacterium BCK34]|nr:GIY-YIG nuclease family protein [Verrucomicrobiales bacterium BCK34]
MTHGRQLRLFLSDGTGSGPRFYEIVNRTIQALGIPAVRIKEANSPDWPEFQRPGVYMVFGLTEDGEDRLYIGRGEDVAYRVQVHPEKQPFEVTRLLLFTSKDENLNASQVGWLESSMIQAVNTAKRITLNNANCPKIPSISKAELATVSEFFEDVKLIAQTAGFDYFEKPKTVSQSPLAEAFPLFYFHIPTQSIEAKGRPADEGFVVLAGSHARVDVLKGLSEGYRKLRKQLIEQGVLVSDPSAENRLVFAQDYAFSAPSPAASIVAAGATAGTTAWKTEKGEGLAAYLESLTSKSSETAPDSSSQ